jgi:serine/threonine-protein kinase
MELILARALAKAPEDRFPSMAALAEALGAVESSPAAREAPRAARRTAGETLLERILERLRPDGALFREGFAQAPRLNLNYGTAGAACALYRIAVAREEAELLSLADLWAARAVAAGTPDEGFYNAEVGLSKEMLGTVTPYHSPSGPLAVQALVAHALGDGNTQRRAVEGFLAAVRQPCESADLTLGRSGVLLAAALLLDTLKGGTVAKELEPRVRELGDELLAGLWQDVDAQPPIARARREWANLGMAHGWAGYLYATLRWCRISRTARPEGLEARLTELGNLARSWGRGLRWPWRDKDNDAGTMPGWCNGSAGFVHLWTLAHRELGDPRWLDLAEGAAWHAWEAPDANGTICCGYAGRAWALLDLWKHQGQDIWLERARDLGERAAEIVVRVSEVADSLYKGEIGVAVLAADLAKPETAAQPFFGDEDWG